MAYNIKLSFNNEAEVIVLPINPDEIEISESGRGSTHDILGEGEVNIIGSPSLTQYTFSSFFPSDITRHSYPFLAHGDIQSPEEYISKITNWMGKKHPIRLKIASDSFQISEPVSIEDFTWKEVAGASGDIEFSLKFKKYVFFKASIAKVVEQKNQEQKITTKETRINENETPKTYTLVKGDSLWKIAKRFLGDGNKYHELQKLNNITDAQLKRLQIGSVIKLQ